MPTISLTQEPHNVFNELDHHGVLLGLIRLEKEKNPEYKQRLMDVMVNRASSTYIGLINGITRELGLKISRTINIQTLVDADENPLLPEPAIIFQDSQMIIYEDFCTGDVLLQVDRSDPTLNNFTIGNIITTINNTGYFIATIQDDISTDQRSMTIFNQGTISIVPSEDISNGGLRVRLNNNNLIEGTVSVSSPNLVVQKNSPNNLHDGEFFVDLKSGTVISAQVPAPGSIIRYKYRDNNFMALSSPVIIHNIQSNDFRRRMFQQVLDELGVEQNGLPNNFGADIINELLSVFPSLWGS